MKHMLTRCAAILALGMIGSPAALAQAVPPGLYPDTGTALPPQEAITVVRSTGLEPLGRPVRRGPVYVLRALDPGGGEVRVIVDAEMGHIVRMVPVVMARGVPIVRPPGRVAMAPDAYGPNARIQVEGAGLAAAPPEGAIAASGPPLPRPRPKLARADAPADSPAAAGPAASPKDGRINETTGAAGKPVSPPLPPLEE